MGAFNWLIGGLILNIGAGALGGSVIAALQSKRKAAIVLQAVSAMAFWCFALWVRS